jgi:hypothetical protein
MHRGHRRAKILGERHEMADDPIPFVLAGIVVSWVLTAYRTGRVIAGLTPQMDPLLASQAACGVMDLAVSTYRSCS